jgi:hypothetical protein
MWLRTLMNYQYVKGTSLCETARLLNREGGIARF